MENIQKLPLYEIALNLDPIDLKSLFQTNRKFSSLYKNDYFWKLKREKDYPNNQFSNDTNFTEKTNIKDYIKPEFYMVGEKIIIIC